MLLRARVRAGYSQHELAARLKRPQSYVSKYETKQRRLDIIEWLEIAEILNLNIVECLQEMMTGVSPAGNASRALPSVEKEKDGVAVARDGTLDRAGAGAEAPVSSRLSRPTKGKTPRTR